MAHGLHYSVLFVHMGPVVEIYFVLQRPWSYLGGLLLALRAIPPPTIFLEGP